MAKLQGIGEPKRLNQQRPIVSIAEPQTAGHQAHRSGLIGEKIQTQYRQKRSLGFFRLNNHPAHVVAALVADNVLGRGVAALGAERELLCLLRVMRPALAGTGIGLTSLGNGHDSVSTIKYAQEPAAVDIKLGGTRPRKFFPAKRLMVGVPE
jgi:hypothetical protein